MAQPWPLVSVLSKPALCEGQDSIRVTIHCTFQSIHQGLGSTGRDRRRLNRPVVLPEPVHLGKEAAAASLGHEIAPAADVREVLRAATGQTPMCGQCLLSAPRGAQGQPPSHHFPSGGQASPAEGSNSPTNPASTGSTDVREPRQVVQGRELSRPCLIS